MRMGFAGEIKLDVRDLQHGTPFYYVQSQVINTTLPHRCVARTQSTIRVHRGLDAAGHLFGSGQQGWPSFKT